MLHKEELPRYNRHIILSEIGKEGQEKIKRAKVLVVGAGGLGCPVLQYLAAAGVGTIGIVDYDTVQESNLQRQILFRTTDIGRPKAIAAAEHLSTLNPFINFQIYNQKLSNENVLTIFKDFDIIVDGTDNFPARYLISDASVILRKPLVFGSIFKFEGQVSVFNLEINSLKGPTYRCLFPEPPEPGSVPNCSEIGVLGVLPGIVGTIQANEVLKIILKIGEVLSGKLLIFDALKMSFKEIAFESDPDNYLIDSLSDYEDFCGLRNYQDSEKSDSLFREISVQELKDWRDQNKEFFLLDVREPYEYEICNLNGFLMPMNQIQSHIDKIPTDMPVVVYCHHGMRSAMIVRFLSQEFNFTNLYNLEGGIHAWALEIDPDMNTY